MSVKVMGRVWDLKLPHNKRLVLLAMADHADHEGRNIYPSTDLIAWKTGYSARQVQRVIDTLIADGILVVVTPPRQQRPTIYAIDLSAGTIKEPFQGRQNVTSQGRQNVTSENPGVTKSHLSGVTFRPSRGDIAMSPEPWNHDDLDHDSVIPSSSPTRASEKSDGDGDGRTLAFLIDRGVGAAAEFAHLPFEPMRLDYEARIADGQTNAIIVRAWRSKPPTKEYHYERRTTQDQPRRSGRGSHNGTGGQELKNPGWMAREFAKLGIEDPSL